MADYQVYGNDINGDRMSCSFTAATSLPDPTLEADILAYIRGRFAQHPEIISTPASKREIVTTAV